MPPQIRIPPDRAGEFDLAIDVAILPKTSMDSSRAFTRLRIPLVKALESGGRLQIDFAVGQAISHMLTDNLVTIPEVSDGT